MTDSEQKLLVALVLMVNQHLDEFGDEVDTLSVSAGEHARGAAAAGPSECRTDEFSGAG